MRDNLNHRIPPGAAVKVRREGRGAIPGRVAGIDRDGSYLITIGTGRAAQTIRAHAIQVTQRKDN